MTGEKNSLDTAFGRLTPFEERRIDEMRAAKDWYDFEPRTPLPPAAIARQMAEADRVIASTAGAVKSAGQRGEEKGRFGYFRGMIIIIHPDMPPHIWDGKTMARVDMKPED